MKIKRLIIIILYINHNHIKELKREWINHWLIYLRSKQQHQRRKVMLKGFKWFLDWWLHWYWGNIQCITRDDWDPCMHEICWYLLCFVIIISLSIDILEEFIYWRVCTFSWYIVFIDNPANNVEVNENNAFDPI